MAVVIVVDDQPNVRRSMAMVLRYEGHTVVEAATAVEALDVAASTAIDVVVTDVRLESSTDGVELMRRIKQRDEHTQVVLVTAFGTIDDAVGAMRSGAYDYLTKPADPARLRLTVRRAAELSMLSREVKQLRAHMSGGDEIVAASPGMMALLATVAQLAESDSSVLITGESGTGKELLARALYEQSARRHGRFVPINCGGMAETLLESELFGHRKGAFTGAFIDRKGLLEEADGGVLFLDEIGEMPPSMQIRLLRFLQGGEVRRVGDSIARRVDVRLVAATHRSLEDEIEAGRFRQDLYYRINVVALRVPPLRERVEDIPVLARSFLARTAARMRKDVQGFSSDALELLKSYGWPGNVRELQNVIERALNLASGRELTEADLPASITVPTRAGASTPILSPPRLPSEDERKRLIAALEDSRWNQRKAAVALGMSRTTLWRKLREHQIEA
jgi:two-component system response regulator HydG